MAHFQFAVSGHVLDLLSPTRGVADGLHINSAEFEFRSADWDGMVKWAHFSNPEYNDGEQQDFLLEGDEISSARGLNLPSGIWEVYLTGYLISNDEIIRRNLTESQLIMIVPSGFEDNAAISMVEPTFAEQVIARAESAYADRITNATVTVGEGVGTPTAEVVISGQSGTKSLDFHFDNLLSNGIASFEVSETGYVTITLNDGTVTEYDGIERALEEINDLIIGSAQAEEARQFAEAGRVEAENLRVAAEEARAAEFNTWGDIQYTAEAWAVGQRAGVDVDPTDVTYENNAKYWAEYAEEHADQNQDAFSYVQVGDTTIAADLPQDTLTLIAGDNVTLTPNAENDSITIEASGAVRGVKGNAESTYRTGEINLTPADIGAAPQGTVDDIVVMSDTQPTSPNNRIWIKPGTTISVPTMDDITAAVEALGTDDIDNESTVTGTTTTDALNTLKTGIDTLGNTVAGLGSDDIANDSTVTGTTVSDALDEVKGSLNVQDLFFNLGSKTGAYDTQTWTVTDSRITKYHRCSDGDVYFSDPRMVIGDISWSTNDQGVLTVTALVAGTTECYVHLWFDGNKTT